MKVLELAIISDRFLNQAKLIGSAIDLPEIIVKFHQLLEKHFTTNRSVTFYANALYMHLNALNSPVKKRMGMSAKQVITSKLTIETKFYLTHSSLSVKEIAYKLGFSDPNHFSYFFRKSNKCSPRDLLTPTPPAN